MSGLTSTGFVARRLAVIRAAIEAELGDIFTFGGDTLIGQLVGAIAIEIGLVWEGLADLYRALDPDVATGEALRLIARFRGLTPLGATRGFASITVVGTPGTVIPAGSRARNPTTNVTVETTLTVTIPSGGSRSVTVQTIAPGAAASAVNGITQIVTPVSGWSSISASTLLTGARDGEDDLTLYNRLVATRNTVASVEGAILSRLLRTEGVEFARVLSNRALTTDTNGTPGKAFRVITFPIQSTRPEIEALIAEAIFETQPAGIQSAALGSLARTAQVIDAQGVAQTVLWEYVSDAPIAVEGSFTVVAAETDLDAAAIKAVADQAIEGAIDALSVGEDVTVAYLYAALQAAVVGLLNITDLRLDAFSSPPTGTTSIVIPFNQIARADYADFSVVMV